MSLGLALAVATTLHQFRREVQATRERAEALLALSAEQGLLVWVAGGTILRGWVLAEQRQGEEGITQMRQGMVAFRDTGAEVFRSYFLALLAEACGKTGQAEEGLTVLTEALAAVDKNEERWYEAELYRLKGELLLNDERGTLNDELKTFSVHRSSFRIQRSEEANVAFGVTDTREL